MEKAVAYYRVSTKRQGKSRLGLEVQQDAVNLYTRFTGTEIVRECFEVESGKNCRRPELKKALRFFRVPVLNQKAGAHDTQAIRGHGDRHRCQH